MNVFKFFLWKDDAESNSSINIVQDSKALADDKINEPKKIEICFGKGRNVTEGENAGNQHFLLFS